MINVLSLPAVREALARQEAASEHPAADGVLASPGEQVSSRTHVSPVVSYPSKKLVLEQGRYRVAVPEK